MTATFPYINNVDWWIEKLWMVRGIYAHYERLGYSGNEESMRRLAGTIRSIEDVIEHMWSSFTCPECGLTSYNPNDIENGYCGNCHWWTKDPQGVLNRPEVIARVKREGIFGVPKEFG